MTVSPINQQRPLFLYLGKGPLCGAQLRYVIKSSRYGWLGGMSFSAAAWRVTVRDQWVGWSEAQRERNLKRVLNNSRFLILPHVHVLHLASHVLGQIARRVGKDFKKRYGEKPILLETFVDSEKYSGTCYRAANWQEIGMTGGRGRQDQQFEANVSRKRVFVYPLSSNWKERLHEGPERGMPRAPQDPADWAEEEWGRADLGDERLNKRLEE